MVAGGAVPPPALVVPARNWCSVFVSDAPRRAAGRVSRSGRLGGGRRRVVSRGEGWRAVGSRRISLHNRVPPLGVFQPASRHHTAVCLTSEAARSGRRLHAAAALVDMAARHTPAPVHGATDCHHTRNLPPGGSAPVPGLRPALGTGRTPPAGIRSRPVPRGTGTRGRQSDGAVDPEGGTPVVLGTGRDNSDRPADRSTMGTLAPPVSPPVQLADTPSRRTYTLYCPAGRLGDTLSRPGRRSQRPPSCRGRQWVSGSGAGVGSVGRSADRRYGTSWSYPRAGRSSSSRDTADSPSAPGRTDRADRGQREVTG